MSLIINGIDFDKRLDDAKHQLHGRIELRADAYAWLPYFNKCHILRERNPESIPEWIRRKGMEIRHKDKFIPLITSN
jgi:hypothetical protein